MMSYLLLLILLSLTGRSLAAAITCPDSLKKDLAAAAFSSPSIVHNESDEDFATSFKVFNLRIPVVPCAVVRAQTAKDVAEAVKAAAASGVHVQARSGGHSFGNYGLGGKNGGLVVWLEALNSFEMDQSSWYATVGGGTQLGDLAKELQLAGDRITPFGTCPSVGIGGHATIGGLGPLSRQYGMLLDQMVAVEVVTANGTILNASADENSDLFWALRGAGASFGIITRFTIKTYPSSTTVQYSYKFTLGDHASGTDIFMAWQTFISNPSVDRRLASLVTFAPGLVSISGTFYGTQAEFDATGFAAALGDTPSSATAEVRSAVGAILHDLEESALSSLADKSSQFYSKTLTIKVGEELTREAVHSWLSYMDEARKGTPIYFVIADFQAGKTNDIPMDSTAYAHRDALWMLQSYAVAPLIVAGYNQRITDFLSGINEKIRQAMPHSTFGAYPGYVDPMLPKDDANIQYWGTNYPRLLTLKGKWDPRNVFANPQSVGQGW